jgi:hypothetical protein
VRKRQEEWQQDINARQRNIAFPDAAQDEGRLWRNLVNGNQKLTIVQAIGAALIFLTIVGISWREAVRTFTFATSGSTLDRLVATLERLGSHVTFALGLLAIIFLFLRWRVRRVLLSERRPNRLY